VEHYNYLLQVTQQYQMKKSVFLTIILSLLLLPVYSK
jgi:hypothetical protein